MRSLAALLFANYFFHLFNYLNMKLQLKTAAGLLLPLLLLAACQKNTTDPITTDEAASQKPFVDLQERGNNNNSAGRVYTITNAVSGNAVIVYSRSSNGTLTYWASYPTGGNGTGGGLGNQGAVVIAKDKNILLAVNAGSNSISSLKIQNNELELISTVHSGGMRPVSIAQHEGFVYVLNAGGTNNISGFTLADDGTLTALANSTRPLSAASTGPAQVSFVNDGKVLAITEKATNKIVTYSVNSSGLPMTMRSITSSSATPFGFDTGKKGVIVVSEAVGGEPGASVLSSYSIGGNGTIELISGSVGAGQSAACWVVITNNGKHAFTTNTASNNISSYNVTNSGGLSVLEAISTTTQAGPIDAALTNNSKFLYVLNGAARSIQAYEVGSNGSLTFIQTVTGLPAGANGLAAK